MFPEADERYMRRALELARLGWGSTNPNPMVGAVIVRDGVILGEGYHHGCGLPHAEVEAIRDARDRGNDPAGAAIYVTLEPCSTYGRTPPCTGGLIAAGIKTVFIGCLDPNPRHAGKGVEILREAGLTVESGICEAECRKLNEAFFHWITTNKPWVILKMAVTLDGKIACANGDSKWVTSEAARSRVQELRRLADAVMVGKNTALTDRPSLTVREPENWPHQPLKLIASHRPADREQLDEIFGSGNYEQAAVSTPEDWERLLQDLGQRRIMVLLIEGGGELAASALSAGAVDFVEFHIAPKILGGRGSRSAVAGADPDLMLQAHELDGVQVSRLGCDVVVSGYWNKNKKE